MKFDFEQWNSTTSTINPKPNVKIIKTFFGLLHFMEKMQWIGACHATSAVLYILFREQGFNAELYVGEVGTPPIVFDHSWVEIDNEVYDAAISSTLIDNISFPPVLANIDLVTGEKTKIQYGVTSGQGYDPVAQQIKQMPFENYMSNFPNHPKGLWGIAKEIGEKIGVPINLGSIKSRYTNTAWNERA